jgi:hypothetical protein
MSLSLMIKKIKKKKELYKKNMERLVNAHSNWITREKNYQEKKKKKNSM